MLTLNSQPYTHPYGSLSVLVVLGLATMLSVILGVGCGGDIGPGYVPPKDMETVDPCKAEVEHFLKLLDKKYEHWHECGQDIREKVVGKSRFMICQDGGVQATYTTYTYLEEDLHLTWENRTLSRVDGKGSTTCLRTTYSAPIPSPIFTPLQSYCKEISNENICM